MPTPPRRRPAAGPTGRRPRVAGLRKPQARPEPEETRDEQDPAAPVRPAAAPGTGRTDESSGVEPDGAEPDGVASEGVASDVEPDGAADGGASDTESVDGGDSAGQTSGPPPPGYPAEEAAGHGGSGAVDKGDEGHGGDADDTGEGGVTDEDGRHGAVVAGTVTDGVLTAAPREESGQAHENDDEGDAVGPKRPSPSGKRRSGGRVAPSSLAGAERAAGGSTRAKASVEPGRRAVNLAIGLAVAALLCAALGLFFKGQADRLTSGADRGNAAFTDPAGTAEVKTKIVAALERALSYDYRDLDKTAAAVQEVLAGKAVCEYEAMFGQLKELAPAQKLVHTTIVRELGVRSLSGDRAEALVFIDQTSTRVEKNQTSASGAQLGVTAERIDGQWKITAFDTFNQPLPNGQPLPQC